MSESKLKSYIEEANPILESFLTTLLQQDLTFTFDLEGETGGDVLTEDATARFTVSSKLESPNNFVIQLDPGWISILSSGMLGQGMSPDDDGAADIASEVIAQGYGAVRNKLSDGSRMPEAYFDAFAPGVDLPETLSDGSFWRLPFQLTSGDVVTEGALYLAAETVDQLAESEAPPAAPAPAPAPAVDVSRPSFPDFGRESMKKQGGSNFDLLAEVELNVTVELGRRRIPLSDVLQLTNGSVIELEKLVGEPLEIFANGRLIAEGEAVVIIVKESLLVT
jgi:flagellar motor switch protein FliN/FliY